MLAFFGIVWLFGAAMFVVPTFIMGVWYLLER